jgi:predicted small metal-binding protein
MTKVIKCRDVGFDCNGVIKAQTEDEADNIHDLVFPLRTG